MIDTANLLAALDRVIDTTDGFVATWGIADPAMVEQLEKFAGWSLPAEFREFALRFGNANIGYIPVHATGPVRGFPAAQLLTEERRVEWPNFPANCLALGEENTDLIVLRSDGVVEFRTESSRNLAVFKSYPSFVAFLKFAIDEAVERAKWLNQLPPNFDPWQLSG